VRAANTSAYIVPSDPLTTYIICVNLHLISFPEEGASVAFVFVFKILFVIFYISRHFLLFDSSLFSLKMKLD
jgi:hypothetical protein